MKEFFLASPAMAWSVVSVLLAAVVIALLWEKVKWWWLNTWYKFPLIGKLARLSRDPSGKDEDGWSRAERTLCHDYMKFMLIQDEHDFNEKKAYLRYATESSRKPMPPMLWVLVCLMVFVEAMGFSYVLAGYTIPGASENLQQTGAYGIAFLISVMLVGFTHWAGHEWYASSKIQTARREWREHGQDLDLYRDKVTLDMPQDSDAGQPAYSRMLNRFEHKHASFKILTFTAILVLAVAAGATYVRGQVLDKQLLQETMNPASASLVQDSAANDPLANVANGVQVPDVDKASHQAAVSQGIKEGVETDKKGGWGTFVVLAFIFVFLQIFGVLFGYKFGFAGEESELAFRAIGSGRYATYADVRAQYELIRNTAQAMLSELQQRIMHVRGSKAKEGNKTFAEFLSERRAEATKDRMNSVEHAAARKVLESRTRHAQAESVTTSHPEPSQPAAGLVTILNEVDALASKDDKKKYISSLPDGVRSEVMQVLKQRKDEAEARARQQDSELDDLL
jgi:hypothetical protein